MVTSVDFCVCACVLFACLCASVFVCLLLLSVTVDYLVVCVPAGVCVACVLVCCVCLYCCVCDVLVLVCVVVLVAVVGCSLSLLVFAVYRMWLVCVRDLCLHAFVHGGFDFVCARCVYIVSMVVCGLCLQLNEQAVVFVLEILPCVLTRFAYCLCVCVWLFINSVFCVWWFCLQSVVGVCVCVRVCVLCVCVCVCVCV